MVVAIMNRNLDKAMLNVPRHQRKLLVFKTFQGAASILLVYYGIQYLPLVVVSLLSNIQNSIIYTIPVLIMIFSYYFLKE